MTKMAEGHIWGRKYLLMAHIKEYPPGGLNMIRCLNYKRNYDDAKSSRDFRFSVILLTTDN